MIYDPSIPAERQISSWSCSIRTATFMLKSLGIDMDASRLQDVLVPDYVTPALGLIQGDGSGLAAVLADQSGCPTGHRWVDWAWLQAHAGTMPVGMGSPSLYHWVAVRGVQADGSLALANPAPGYQGLGDTMTAAQFQQWAPWAAVWIEMPAAEGDDGMRDSQIVIVNEEIIGNLTLATANISAALNTPRLPAAARTALQTAQENLTAGALPAAQTLSRDEG